MDVQSQRMDLLIQPLHTAFKADLIYMHHSFLATPSKRRSIVPTFDYIPAGRPILLGIAIINVDIVVAGILSKTKVRYENPCRLKLRARFRAQTQPQQ